MVDRSAVPTPQQGRRRSAVAAAVVPPGEPTRTRSLRQLQVPIPAEVSHLASRPGIRRFSRTVAIGGGGLTLLGVTGVGVLVAEARLAQRWIVRRMSTPHDVDGRYDGRGRLPSGRRARAERSSGPALLVSVLGDSAAAGLGADDPAATPGVLLATGVAGHTGRVVQLRTETRSGAVSAELAGQVDRLEADGVRPDVVLIIIGGNDVKSRVPAPTAARQLGEAVARLSSRGTLVVVGTVPDLGTITSVQQPLRALGGRWSRRLAEEQTRQILANGGHPVDLRGLMAQDFRTDAAAMFSEDRFHPSTDGYRRTMSHVVPVVLGLLDTSAPRGDAEIAVPAPRVTDG
jgi:lysophospholipase L1-like esterase